MRKPLTLALLLLAIAAALGSRPVTAQIVLVDNEYVVTEMRPGKNQFGVALHRHAATQNWVHVRADTRISVRHWLGRGRGFNDEVIPPSRLFNYLRLGMKVRVAGGRAWDGSVAARQIWF